MCLGLFYVGMTSSGLRGAAYEVEPTWKKDSPGSNRTQEIFCEFRLLQEDRKPGGGPERASTRPQWEHNHDQKKGVRIGESK
eukprot:1912887-Heterocapsa_arctica.AAC.1